MFFCFRLEGKPLNFLTLLCCQRIEASSFCLFNLLGLVKCLAEILLRLLAKSGKATLENRSAKPSAKIVFKLRFIANNSIKLEHRKSLRFWTFPASQCISWLELE